MFSKKFIAATKENTTYEKHIPAPMLRKIVTVGKPIKEAALTVCGLGFYELYLNGERLTKGLLAPYISNPNDVLYYDRYDVTAALHEGKNALGFLLGNGHLNAVGGMIWEMHLAPYRSAPKVAFALEITYADGTGEILEADESVKTAPSAILFDDLRCGEIVDARRKTLAPVSIKKSRITHQSEPRAVLPVMPLDEPEEGYLYDFGINTAGNIRLRIAGEAGQTVTLQFGELLAEDPKTPLEVTDTLMCMNLCRKAATMFRAVGLDFHADIADNLFARLKTAARRHLIEADGATVRGHTQAGQVLGIRYGLFDGAEKNAAFAVLMDIIRESDNKLDCGALCLREIFHVLAQFGRTELAYKMLVGPEYPSFGHWIVSENGTALFEDFGTPNTLPQSKNHHFLGDISAWFIKWLAGIKVNPYERDCNEVEISPVFLNQLDCAEGTIDLPCGKVAVRWAREGDGIRLTVNTPEGCRGIIKMPAGYDITEKRYPRITLEAGEHTYDVYKL